MGLVWIEKVVAFKVLLYAWRRQKWRRPACQPVKPGSPNPGPHYPTPPRTRNEQVPRERHNNTLSSVSSTKDSEENISHFKIDSFRLRDECLDCLNGSRASTGGGMTLFYSNWHASLFCSSSHPFIFSVDNWFIHITWSWLTTYIQRAIPSSVSSIPNETKSKNDWAASHYQNNDSYKNCCDFIKN